MTITLCSMSRRRGCRPGRPRRGHTSAVDPRSRELGWAALEARYPERVYDIVADRMLRDIRVGPAGAQPGAGR
jgi:hypothetical protein